MDLAKMENNVIIVLTPSGAVIGKMQGGGVVSPRFLVATPNGPTISIEFRDIIGNPEVFFFGAAPYYVSVNSELNSAYLKAVSLIEVVNTVVLQ